MKPSMDSAPALPEPLVPTTSGKYTIRELSAAEYPELLKVEPFNRLGLPDSASSRVIVAQDEAGAIVGYWFLMAAVHVEPFWLAPDHTNRFLSRRMWEAMTEMLKQTQANVAYGIIPDADTVTAGMASRLGFMPVPGKLFFITLDPKDAEQESSK